MGLYLCWHSGGTACLSHAALISFGDDKVFGKAELADPARMVYQQQHRHDPCACPCPHS